METPKYPMATLQGGVDYEAVKRDGTKEQVKILQLPIKLMPQYGAALTNEPALVELLCNRPKDWSDGLTNECFEHIVVTGREIHKDFFACFQQRQREAIELLNPGVTEEVIKAMVSRFVPTSPTAPPNAP